MSTLKRDQEQTRWGIPLHKPSLFRIPALLFKQSLGVGGLPTPLLVWERPPGGRVVSGMPGSCCTPADSWEDKGPLRGSYPPTSLRPKGPLLGDRKRSGHPPTAPLRLICSSEKWEKHFLLDLPPRWPRAPGRRRGKTPGCEASTRAPGPPRRPPAGRCRTSPESAVSSLPSRNTLH